MQLSLFVWISAGFTCQYDWISIYGGNSSNWDVLGRFCGTTPPEPLVSQGSMHIEFVTDESVTDKGWKAVFRTQG